MLARLQVNIGNWEREKMAKKIIQCKTCGSSIAKNAAICPNCGAKNKKKHPALGMFLVLFGVALIFAAFGSSSDAPQKVGNASDQQATASSDTQKTEFGVGEKVELNDVAVTLVDVSESSGKDFFEPTEGNVFVICEFEIENNTSGDIAVSSMMSFEAYFDDYAANIDISAMTLSGKTQLDGSVASGKKIRGVVGYQAPSDWTTAELRFTPSFWSSKDIVFTYTK